MGKKIVFLDRDGVINKLVERDGRMVSPQRIEDFELFPNVASAIKKLQEMGFEIVVVTNQPDISRGLMNLSELEKMNGLVHSLGIKHIRVCPHSNEDHCTCRKPKPGLLEDFIRIQTESIDEIWLIGDNASDIEAGTQVHASTILITGSGVESQLLAHPSYKCIDLAYAVEIISSEKQKHNQAVINGK